MDSTVMALVISGVVATVGTLIASVTAIILAVINSKKLENVGHAVDGQLEKFKAELMRAAALATTTALAESNRLQQEAYEKGVNTTPKS